MFTGLISDIGTIAAAREINGGLRLDVNCAYKNIALGESIAVNGCCLTVVANTGSVSFDLSAETLKCTAPRWKAGERVNLERALAVGERLGGHLVAGHIDGMAKILKLAPAGDSHLLTIEAPEPLKKFIAAKGSVTLDGVSLTVNTVEDSAFTVNIIPLTWRETTLGGRKAGDMLNLEVDLIARYLERLLAR